MKVNSKVEEVEKPPWEDQRLGVKKLTFILAKKTRLARSPKSSAQEGKARL
jgi:hypothetical protein